MEIDYEGNICASELRIRITPEAEMQASRVGLYRDDGFLRAARDLGLEVERGDSRLVVSVYRDFLADAVTVTYRDDWQQPTRR